jgi:glycosyltransferase involved in cell wall biosynthesis
MVEPSAAPNKAPGSFRPPRIAFLGSRGIPANYGGFETFIQELSVRLVVAGFNVTVFCHGTQSYKNPTYRGVRLIHINTPPLTGLRSVWFDVVSMVKALGRYDIIYVVGYNVAWLLPIARLFPGTLWVNMDGIAWRRTKWSRFARSYLRLMELIAAHSATRLIADAQAIADHLTTSYSIDPQKVQVIEYGAYPLDVPPSIAALERFGLTPQEYYLVVCRLEPENHVREIIDGYLASGTTWGLVIVGDHTTDTAYVHSLLAAGGDRMRFVGTIFDQGVLTALRFHCRAYIHGHSVGGTNPSLLEAMACGNYVIAHDNSFNREVMDNLCRYFRNADDVTMLLDEMEHWGIPLEVGAKLKDRVVEYYNWERIARVYAARFRESVHFGR